ncbi:dienelactone hydrolase, putative [Talaromyces stipitatus ATCC 10500]|uniref:Dienelactone hydrolase, putative n=1 Tax=Talaromyces stipitatus (strain ATCC 10500 / CBS 375.48 / QM 6759 / NRRL 1006) TaxID=441959 RepID=B8MKX0_TALSN|nr:dienelactone hydrolase, putative [Talaromyces stipitatus ATCC 10500]EED14969.1 dienelactone hydrolase, putative [Talaromyces stipitatus ATCC 10500]
MSTAESCCTRTPIGTNQKVPVVKIANLDTYVTGNTSSKSGVVVIYDIFGFYPQTLQGADLLAAQTGAVTFVPDVLENWYALHDWIPPDNEEKRIAFQTFFAENAAPPLVLPKVNAWLAEAKGKYPSVEKWGILGLCWGGKIAVLESTEGTSYAVSGQVHPGLYDANDAKNAVIPHVVLASKDESTDVTAEYKAIFEKSSLDSYVETYTTMHHGWMGARADLDDAENKKEYERGYKEIGAFFSKYL